MEGGVWSEAVGKASGRKAGEMAASPQQVIQPKRRSGGAGRRCHEGELRRSDQGRQWNVEYVGKLAGYPEVVGQMFGAACVGSPLPHRSSLAQTAETASARKSKLSSPTSSTCSTDLMRSRIS